MKNFDGFTRFCRMQLATGDYDSHIPLLTALAEHLALEWEESIWLGLLYMAYYSEGSAWCAFLRPGVRCRTVLPPSHYPITTQRRNLYGGRITRHFRELLEIPCLDRWLACDTWEGLLSIVGSVYGNGRWASYTTSELLTHLGEIDIEPSTYEILESSGPKQGLQALGLAVNEDNAGRVSDRLIKEGVIVPPSVLESLLCDWAGMNKGTFYAGRNIDRQQGRILQVEERLGVNCSTLWKIRRRVFPTSTLGELNGWEGINRARLKVYRDTGKILRPEENR